MKTLKLIIGWILVLVPIPATFLSTFYLGVPAEVSTLSDPMQWVFGIGNAFFVGMGIVLLVFTYRASTLKGERE